MRAKILIALIYQRKRISERRRDQFMSATVRRLAIPDLRSSSGAGVRQAQSRDGHELRDPPAKPGRRPTE